MCNRYLQLSAYFLVMFVALSTGCGGSGNSTTQSPPPASSPAQGLWTGVAANNRTVTNLILGDNSYYIIYSPVGNPNAIAGVIQGTGSVSGASFASNNAKDFGFETQTVDAATLTATISPKSTFNGIADYGVNGSVNFNLGYSAVYETRPTLAGLVGAYSGQVALLAGGVQNATLTVSASGAISGSSSGCSYTGTAVPRTDGNAYNITLIFGAGSCAFPGKTLNGIGYVEAATSLFYIIAPDAGRTNGVLFIGSTAAPATPTAALSTITLPAASTFSANTVQQLSATGTYADGTVLDISGAVTWASSNTAVATVNAAGLVTGVSAGIATITATQGATSGSTTVTINVAAAASGAVDPALVGIWQGSKSTVTYNADGTFDFISLYQNFGTCLTTYRMESYNNGTFTTSGNTLTENKTSGTLKTWNCIGVYRPLQPDSITNSGPSTKTYTYSISGVGTGAVLTMSDGTTWSDGTPFTQTYTKQ